VATGAGVTLVPELALAVEGTPGSALAFVPFPKPQPARTICLAWRRTSPRGPEFRLLGEVLTSEAPKPRR
jgi:LysR family hydrogen peroxide-inducible transcriptional activator